MHAWNILAWYWLKKWLMCNSLYNNLDLKDFVYSLWYSLRKSYTFLYSSNFEQKSLIYIIGAPVINYQFFKYIYLLILPLSCGHFENVYLIGNNSELTLSTTYMILISFSNTTKNCGSLITLISPVWKLRWQICKY